MPKARIVYYQYLNYAYAPVVGSVMFLTGSRLAIFIIFPAVLYILYTIIQSRGIATSLILLIVVIGAIIVAQQFIPQPTWERLTTARSSILKGDLGGRVPILKGRSNRIRRPSTHWSWRRFISESESLQISCP